MLYDEESNTSHLKILVYGPALSGKSTLLTKLFQAFKSEEHLIQLKNTVCRTIFEYGVIHLRDEKRSIVLHLFGTGGH